MVNIFIYAMQMEKDGEEYYYKLAQETNDKGLRAVFSMLAQEEAKHYEMISKARTARPQMAETSILTDAKNIFAQIKESGESFDPEPGEAGPYIKAQEIEKKSMEFYREKAGEVEQEYQKELFLKLAEEEKKHYFLLENIIDFVSRPETWLENAEFCHLEEY